MGWVKEHLLLISVLWVIIIPGLYRLYRQYRAGQFGSPGNGWFEKNTEKTVGEMEWRGDRGNSFLRLTVHALDPSRPEMDVGVDITSETWGKPKVTAPLALSADDARRLARLLRAAANY